VPTIEQDADLRRGCRSSSIVVLAFTTLGGLVLVPEVAVEAGGWYAAVLLVLEHLLDLLLGEVATITPTSHI
jgi:hypothetical protein